LREDDVQGLIEIEPEDRGALSNRRPHLQRAAVYTHERCNEHWLRFLEIAEHYGSAEEAAAADAEAGRKPREQPAPGVPEPERNEAPRLKNPMPQMPDAREHGLKDERR
jgi:hypothetical protein